MGADVYSLYPVVDAIAHEYEFGEGDHMASERSPLELVLLSGRHAHVSRVRPGQGDLDSELFMGWREIVDKREAMMNLAMSQVMDGANFWDAPGHSMAGSNDPATRKKIFSWIKQHEKTFYSPRTPINPIGVYFSPETRNYLRRKNLSGRIAEF